MNKSIITAALLLMASVADAQSTTLQAISSAGGYFTGSNGSVSFTIGQTAANSYSGAGGMLTQGFQQSIEASTPLPLQFLSFTAILIDDRTSLQWITTREQNTGYFEVQRSSDGSVFSTLLTVQSGNNPIAENSYHAVDSFPYQGVIYYRLKEVDLNGLYFYSPIVIVNFSSRVSCMVYPNPASDQVFIRIQSDDTKHAAVGIYGIGGQLLMSRQIQLVTGINQYGFNISNLTKGLYIFKISGLDGLPSFIIIKR